MKRYKVGSYGAMVEDENGQWVEHAALAAPPAEDASRDKIISILQVFHRVLYGANRFVDYGCLVDAVAALKAQAPPAEDAPGLELDNHHNALRCPHCNPKGLVLCDPAAARQSDPPGLVANWRPIETAPKRTDVLAGWADRPHWLPQVLQQDDAGMWFNGEESDYRPPTHWMPLPASPQAETKGDE